MLPGSKRWGIAVEMPGERGGWFLAPARHRTKGGALIRAERIRGLTPNMPVKAVRVDRWTED